MVKKSKHEIEIDIKSLRTHIQETIPSFISPNGGSLEELQKEIQAVYRLILNIIDSLDPKVWVKKE